MPMSASAAPQVTARIDREAVAVQTARASASAATSWPLQNALITSGS